MLPFAPQGPLKKLPATFRIYVGSMVKRLIVSCSISRFVYHVKPHIHSCLCKKWCKIGVNQEVPCPQTLMSSAFQGFS